MRRSFDLSCYFIVDPEACLDRPPEDVVKAALDGGATLVQYRDKRGDVDLVRDGAMRVKRVMDDHIRDVPFLINDYPQIMCDVGADGVHIGQGDMPAMHVRELIGPEAILGLTAFTEDHLGAVNPFVVDYVGTGPVYPTKTDKGKPILGVEALAGLVALSPVPMAAIGGINARNAAMVMKANVNGVAVMRAISAADDPDKATRALVRAIKN